MRTAWVFAGVGLLAILAGTATWLGSRGAVPPSAAIAPASLLAAAFSDTAGQPQTLAQFQGKVVVLNFWATWCAPCREEMPAFSRLQQRWAARGVQFVGLSGEDPEKVDAFARSVRVAYPLWVGGDSVGELSRRLGNRQGVLPYTVILDGQGNVLAARVGPYLEPQLDEKLTELAGIRTRTSSKSMGSSVKTAKVTAKPPKQA